MCGIFLVFLSLFVLVFLYFYKVVFDGLVVVHVVLLIKIFLGLNLCLCGGKGKDILGNCDQNFYRNHSIKICS